MSLEERIRKLLNDAVKSHPSVLEGSVGMRDPKAPISPTEQLDILRTQVHALRDAILIIASEIDEGRKTGA